MLNIVTPSEDQRSKNDKGVATITITREIIAIFLLKN